MSNKQIVKLVEDTWTEFDGTAIDIAVGPTKAPYIISDEFDSCEEISSDIGEVSEAEAIIIPCRQHLGNLIK